MCRKGIMTLKSLMRGHKNYYCTLPHLYPGSVEPWCPINLFSMAKQDFLTLIKQQQQQHKHILISLLLNGCLSPLSPSTATFKFHLTIAFTCLHCTFLSFLHSSLHIHCKNVALHFDLSLTFFFYVSLHLPHHTAQRSLCLSVYLQYHCLTTYCVHFLAWW